MAKYLFSGIYQPNGVQGLVADGGSTRREQVSQLISSMGGKLESFYYTLSGDGVHGFVDMPDNINGTALGLAINASGAVTLEITALVSPEDLDLAIQKLPSYSPPGS